MAFLKMEPDRLAKKAIEQGKRARLAGKTAEDNPHFRGPLKALAAWWDKGWTEGGEMKPKAENNGIFEKSR